MDACLSAKVLVDMVEADGGGGDKAHITTLQQLLIYVCTRANKECICVTHSFGCDFFRREVNGFYLWGEDTLKKRNPSVNDNEHKGG